MSNLDKVKEFHSLFQHSINDINVDVPLKERQMRIKIIFEELQELAEASGCHGTFEKLCKENTLIGEDSDNVNKKEQLDALVDIEYVVLGGVLTFGFKDVFDKGFDLVHSSNMSKACNTEQEAIDTVNSAKEKSHYIKRDNKWFVYRDSDGKTIKSINYNEVNLSELL